MILECGLVSVLVTERMINRVGEEIKYYGGVNGWSFSGPIDGWKKMESPLIWDMVASLEIREK